MTEDVKVTWPEVTRAQGALTAYSTAQDWVRRLPAHEMDRRLTEKIEEKQAIIDRWNTQQKAK